jgi:K(+)-stimulated pyrophosphate-energized sodium pump
MIELWLIVAFALLGLAFAVYLARWVLAFPPSDAPRRPAGRGALRTETVAPLAPVDREMAKIASLVRATADAFFTRQSSTILALSAVLGGAIFLAYGLYRHAGERELTALELGVWLTVSFALGAVGSVTAGRVAVWITTRASLRTAAGVRRSTDLAVQIALRGGAVSGLFITATALLGQVGLFAAVLAYKGGFGREPALALSLAGKIPFMTAGYALGASFAALLANLGGGTFAKAADIAADIAGKELGIDEDDPRNPAVIADLAGDIVGDAAGRGAGIFESTVAENLGAMCVGALLYRDNPKLESVLPLMLFPLVTRAFGVVAAVFGVMVVRTDDREDPRSALGRGLYVTAVLSAVGFAGAAKWLLGNHWLPFLACGALGIGAAVAFLHLTQFYTEHRHRPVRELAEASRGGPTLTLLFGLVAGLESTLSLATVMLVTLVTAFQIGAATGLTHGGLYAVAVATMGMLGPAGYLLAMDAFGPIVDNAAGIIEMTVARDRPDVRGRTVVLDAVGNTVKALTKTWAAGAAGLAAVLLVAAFLDEVRRRLAGLQSAASASPALHAGLHLERPEVLVASILGVLLALWLCLRCIVGVARPARRVMDEVRRQLKDRPLSPGGSRSVPSEPRASSTSPTPPTSTAPRSSGGDIVPDHEPVIEIVSRAALRHMLAPAIVAVGGPVAFGVALRFGRAEDNALAVADSVAALVMAGTMAGVLGSLLLTTAGGAWDNAKKYIATGAHGGRHIVDESGTPGDNPAYAAALVGDTFGDALKDAAGPAIHVLAKMLPVVMIVFLPFFL